MKLDRLYAKVIAFLGVGFLFCTLLPSATHFPKSAMALTLSKEKDLGKEILEKIKQQLPLVEDREIVSYVQSVGNRIVKKMGTTHYNYKFFVIDRSDPNAFAVPGGYVFIYRGLIELLKSEGELASIISHELAHVQARHIERRLQQGKILNIAAIVGAIAAAFIGLNADSSQAILMGTMAGAKSLQLKYSRDNEVEADQLGFRYLCQAGYDPADMVSAMQALSRNRFQGGGSSIPSYLSTHPGLTERIQYLQFMVENYKKEHPKLKIKRDDEDFQFMRAALISEYGDPRLAEERLKAESRKGWEAAEFGLGCLYMRQGQLAAALPLLQKAAREHSDSALVLSTLGAAYYRVGRLKEARATLETALLLNPSAISAEYNLAVVLKELGRSEEALRHLNAIEEFYAAYPEIDYQLGVLLGQQNNLGLAHYHLGRYYRNRHDWKTAVFHYKKAKSLLQAYPDKQAEIDKELERMKKKSKKIARRSSD